MTKKRNHYTETEADNALCVFEWLLDHNKGLHGEPVIEKLAGSFGWSAMRSACLQAALIVEDVWQHAKGPNDEPEHFDTFDWEFVPAFCRVLDWHKLLDDNQYNGGLWRPDPAPIWAAMVATVALHRRRVA